MKESIEANLQLADKKEHKGQIVQQQIREMKRNLFKSPKAHTTIILTGVLPKSFMAKHIKNRMTMQSYG